MEKATQAMINGICLDQVDDEKAELAKPSNIIGRKILEMLIPIFILFIICSVVWLIWGIQTHSVKLLVALNLLWWVGSFVSAYFVGLAWLDREYSENWAMLGFIFIALPYIIITGGMLLLILFFVRRWQRGYLYWMSWGLLLFLTLQLIAGFLSG